MKVAVSIPDVLHKAADARARRLRVPRSRIYAAALGAYLARASEDEVTARLDAVYAGGDSEPDQFLTEAARTLFKRDR